MKLLIAVSFISWIYIWFMKKNISRAEIYSTWGIVTLFSLFVDLSLGGVLGFYNYGKPGPDLQGMSTHFILEPALAIIFLNYLPSKTRNLILYILAWTIFSLIYEWTMTYIGFLKYSGWKLWYSLFVYPIVFFIIYRHLRFFRYLNHK